MSRYIIAPPAREDLWAIWNYYATEVGDIDLADQVRDELFDGFAIVAKTPGIGHFRKDLAKEPVRFWRVRRYLIIYRLEKNPLEIVRVLHGARDVQAVIGSAEE